MIATTPCPDRIDLERLLLGQAPEDNVAILEEHVGECPACAERLSELATSDDLVQVLRDVPAALARLPRGPVVDDLLERVRRIDAQAISTDFAADTASTGAANLAGSPRAIDVASYLDPPQQPDELGRLGACYD